MVNSSFTFLYYTIRRQIKQTYTYSNRHVGIHRENGRSEQDAKSDGLVNQPWFYLRDLLNIWQRSVQITQQWYDYKHQTNTMSVRQTKKIN